MKCGTHRRSGFALLELLLVLAFLALLFQVFPALWFGLLWAVDVRNWSRGMWMGLNVAIVFALFGLRFGPELFDQWRERRARLTNEHEKHEKQRHLKEEREMLERLKQARERRLY